LNLCYLLLAVFIYLFIYYNNAISKHLHPKKDRSVVVRFKHESKWQYELQKQSSKEMQDWKPCFYLTHQAVCTLFIKIIQNAFTCNYYCLLINVRWPTSFEELRAVNSKVCATNRKAYQELNLLENVANWDTALVYALNTAPRPQKIRTLFSIILITCLVLPMPHHIQKIFGKNTKTERRYEWRHFASFAYYESKSWHSIFTKRV